MQGRDLALQVLHGGDERAERGTLGMEGGILAREVVLDELAQIAVEPLVGDLLPGLQVQPRLVEHAAQTLPVLRDEARHEAAGDYRADEEHTINESTDK